MVDCNIILNESIAYAAQQFGIALYDSLSRSQERLANQANYIIDKNSIRFNSKYWNNGAHPPGLSFKQTRATCVQVCSLQLSVPLHLGWAHLRRVLTCKQRERRQARLKKNKWPLGLQLGLFNYCPSFFCSLKRSFNCRAGESSLGANLAEI